MTAEELFELAIAELPDDADWVGAAPTESWAAPYEVVMRSPWQLRYRTRVMSNDSISTDIGPAVSKETCAEVVKLLRAHLKLVSAR